MTFREIKDAVTSGSYVVDPAAVAAAMIARGVSILDGASVKRNGGCDDPEQVARRMKKARSCRKVSA